MGAACGALIFEKDFDISLSALKNGQNQFSTEVKLDKEWAKKPYRVLISEYELHPFDPRLDAQAVQVATGTAGMNVELKLIHQQFIKEYPAGLAFAGMPVREFLHGTREHFEAADGLRRKGDLITGQVGGPGLLGLGGL